MASNNNNEYDKPVDDGSALRDQRSVAQLETALRLEAASHNKGDSDLKPDQQVETAKLEKAGTIPTIELNQEPSFAARAWNYTKGAADIAGQAVAGAATIAYREVTEHPGRTALHVAEGVGVGVVVIAAAPATAALGAGAAVVAGVELCAYGATAALATYGGVEAGVKIGTATAEASGSMGILMNSDQMSAADVDKARQDVRDKMGTATLALAGAGLSVLGGAATGARAVSAGEKLFSGGEQAASLVAKVPDGARGQGALNADSAITAGTTPRADTGVGSTLPTGAPGADAGAAPTSPTGATTPTTETVIEPSPSTVIALPGANAGSEHTQATAIMPHEAGTGNGPMAPESATTPGMDTPRATPPGSQPQAGENRAPAEGVDKTPERAAPQPENTQQLDRSGRPLSEGHAERIGNLFKPLTTDELAASRTVVERELSEYIGPDGKSGLDNLNSAGFSEAQRGRVLDVFAELREAMLSRTGTQAAGQQAGYVHMIGELGEGLASAGRNGSTPTKTQNTVLAAMLTDVAKWLGPEGNFLTHHLDGALAADVVLGRHLGEGFAAADLEAVHHAILEHQIGPPWYMAYTYTQRIRGELQKKGPISPDDARDIERINELMSDPLHAPVELDTQGGYRVAFTAAQRDLLRTYAGEGTQNWHVPNPANPWDSVSRGVLSADSLDNYYPQVGLDGTPIKGPFKIAGLSGPDEGQTSLASATQGLRRTAENIYDSGLLADGDRPTALLRMQQQNQVYDAARIQVGQWLRQYLEGSGQLQPGAPMDNVAYWSRPLETPADSAPPDAVRSYQEDRQLARIIQQRFVDELQRMRRFDGQSQTDFAPVRSSSDR